MKKILILCQADYTDEALVAYAKKLAKSYSSHITIMHVFEPDSDFVSYDAGPATEREWKNKQKNSEVEAIDGLVSRFQESGFSIEAIVTTGVVSDIAIDVVKKNKIDLVIMGNHRHGLFRRILAANDTNSIANVIECPVLLIPVLEG